MSQRTYAYLLAQASAILDAGFTVIVDAAFLEAQQRAPFLRLATQRQIPFIILQCVASASSLRQRICQREHDASDADLAILENQLSHFTPLSADELPYSITIDTEQPLDLAQLLGRIEHHAARTTHDCPGNGFE
jgi:predicted kinase